MADRDRETREQQANEAYRDMQRRATDAPRLGKLEPPYPQDHCASASCGGLLDDGAYLFKDQDSGKLVVFCDDCARHVELNHSLRFKLVAL